MNRRLAWVIAAVVTVVVLLAVFTLVLHAFPWHAPTDGGYWGGI